MALFLDSATQADAEHAQRLGFIEGITTNPALIAETGRAGLEALETLIDIFDGHVFYQLTADSHEARIDEAWQAYETRPDRVVIKIPMTVDNLGLVSVLSGVDIAITSVFSPAQAYLAAEAGAHYVIPYVNRMTRLLGDGPAVVREMAQVLQHSETQILAASIKSVDEALAALQAGAQNLTMPMAIIEAMGHHELSVQAIEAFKRA